ncbi:Rieske 2Fe-2S domain-containing protein [Micromonospora craniellae]|uniref:Aromatic ring-hydroxylating dioxygenase subunit alpha n=1 Tax=Micromonospora craniellae TaxID=2294034 RepID=A0A372FZE3_9ACTN|nr:Rieske 2Fe-2S domain-containing protein [Micromonospora craniellae]QOC93423.1 Rieske 2Fe-2S domain-containing protein [Micromonospora craniellae]RFS45870.1 aromatic ring-hydroxylating dioxygenase subunit alpha [Micromonospora craniellae]
MAVTDPRPEEPPVAKRRAPRRRPTTTEQPESVGNDWRAWPVYEAADLGFRNYWYPVQWAEQVSRKPVPIQLLGERIVLVREGDEIYALHDRCPHRGVPLSLGRRQYEGTISCPYHGWTYRLDSGKMCAALTDGPESPINNRVKVATYPVAQRLGLVWVYVGDGDPPPVERDIPDELVDNEFVMGGRWEIREGNWRFAAENGFDEGHAKYLHNTALWRLFKVMPAWNKTRIVEQDGWLVRVQDEVHWEADFPGLGKWTNRRWWKRMPLPDAPGKGKGTVNPVIRDLNLPGFVSIRLPGLLRVAYPQFIHYEWYVPVNESQVRYVQIMVRFETGAKAMAFKAKYLAAIRWLFHGQFTAQDAWMVDVMNAPPEKLYRPDLSLTAWRRHIEQANPEVQIDRTPHAT